MASRLFASIQAMRQQQGGAARCLSVIRQSAPAARRIGGHRAKQGAQLIGAGGIETAIGAARQPRDFLERARGGRIGALMEGEDRNAAQPELARERAEL